MGMLLIITSTSDRLFAVLTSMILNDLEHPKRGFKCFLRFLAAVHILQGWIATKWLNIDQANLRTRTAKAVARLMSFAKISCASQRLAENRRCNCTIWCRTVSATKSRVCGFPFSRRETWWRQVCRRPCSLQVWDLRLCIYDCCWCIQISPLDILPNIARLSDDSGYNCATRR